MSEQVDPEGFRVSIYSGGGNCVAVRMREDGLVDVRQSRSPDHQLTFTADEWEAFVKGVKAGEFDPL